MEATHPPALPACARRATRVDTGRTSDVRVLVVEDEQAARRCGGHRPAPGGHGRRRRVRRCGRPRGASASTTTTWSSSTATSPSMHGDDVCRKIVELGMPTRVLMLTASGDVSDRVEGLGLGADDYLPKPFAFSELIARVPRPGPPHQAACRPSWSAPASSSTPTRREVFRDGKRECSSPPRSSPSCEVLMRSEGAVVSRSSCWRRPGTRTPTRSPTSCA